MSSGGNDLVRNKWRWYNDPEYRERKLRSNRITKIKKSIRFHLDRLKYFESELVRLAK